MDLMAFIYSPVRKEHNTPPHPPPSDSFATFKGNTVGFAKTYKLLCSEKAKKASEQHFFPVKSTP